MHEGFIQGRRHQAVGAPRRDLDEIAQDPVVLDLQIVDARLFPVIALQPDDQLA